MRIVFLGTPAEAAVVLRQLHDAGHEIAFVVTQPDRRRGRGGGETPSPVKRTAFELDVPVRTPARARDVVEELRESEALMGVVVAFGQLLPPDVLQALPQGFVNVHFSILPRWRGAAPVERAILAGDEETGVCLMEIDEGLDTGAVYVVERVPIEPHETAGELRARLAEIAGRLLVERLDSLPAVTPTPQEGEPTYAEKLDVAEFELDWTRPAPELARVVRAGNPSPGAWTHAGKRRLKVLRAHAVGDSTVEDSEPGRLVDDAGVVTGRGVLVLDEVQTEGKRPISGQAWARGFRSRDARLR